ncbi:MAG: response regulator [Bacteroidota bacterium]
MSKKNSKILIVDDKPENLQVLKGILSDEGYSVYIASTGTMALERANRLKPTLVLLDVRMPDMSGFEVCQELKSNPDLHSIPVLFVTAANDSKSIAEGFRVGGVDYITKPFQKEELLARVNTHLKIVNANLTLEQKVMERTLELQTEKNTAAEIAENLYVTLQSIGDAVIATDIEGHITRMNPVAERLTGWNSKDALGRKLSEVFQIIDANSANVLPNPVFEVLKSGNSTEYHGYTQLRSKDNALFYISDSASPIRNTKKEIIGVVVVFRDITEEHKMQLALQESESRFKLAAEGTGDGLWDWNPLTDQTFISEQYARMLGYEPGDLPQSDAAWTGLLHPDDKEYALVKVEEYLQGKTDHFEAVFRMKAKDGTYRWIRGRGKALFDENNRATRFVGFITDITEQKETQDEIIRKNQELSDSLVRIQEINAELEEAKEKAELSDRLKTAFLANLSHEIRTPMNGILGFANLLQSEDLDPSRHKRYLDVIKRSGHRMLNLINDLVDISKIESGQVEVVNTETNLNDLLDNLFLLFKPEADAKQLDFSLEKGLADEGAVILTDDVKLEQVLSNLLKNALKFTKKGRIGMAYELKGEMLYFRVEDTGIGIPEGLHETIFERFRKAEDSQFTAEEGSGLGLSISKAFVELMQGEIWVESEVGKGSAFSFTIPYNPVHSKPDAIKEFHGLENIKDEIVILVAEDDEVSFRLLEELLNKPNIRLVQVITGKDAVDAVRNNAEIDMVFMDVKLPGLNGLEAVREIRKFNRKIPVIAQTAYASDSDRKEALNAGCNDYISKPIEMHHFESILHKFLS